MTDTTMVDAELTKRFGMHEVLKAARITVRTGTVHALVGENGAGKSTLVKIIAGVLRADRGTLAIGGASVDASRWDRIRARGAGVGIVQQHGASAGTLSVVENAVLGVEGGPLLGLAATAAALKALGDKVGLPIDPWAAAGELSVGAAQRAEIVAALHLGAKLLILDEPTAVLTPVEVDGLLATLRTLAAARTTIVIVTHKLDEVRAVADDVTVLRAGATVATFDLREHAPYRASGAGAVGADVIGAGDAGAGAGAVDVGAAGAATVGASGAGASDAGAVGAGTVGAGASGAGAGAGAVGAGAVGAGAVDVGAAGAATVGAGAVGAVGAVGAATVGAGAGAGAVDVGAAGAATVGASGAGASDAGAVGAATVGAGASDAGAVGAATVGAGASGAGAVDVGAAGAATVGASDAGAVGAGTAGAGGRGHVDVAAIARAMVGADLPAPAQVAEPAVDAKVVLAVKRVAVAGLVEASLEVRAGEIVGVAGVDGNGQRELALSIVGLVSGMRGGIQLGGRDVTRTSSAARLAAGLAHIPEDRHHGGLLLDATVAENLALGRADITGRWRIDRARVQTNARERIEELDVRPADPDALVRSLSGGNQQKVVVGRELSRPALIAVVASQPTRGVDLGAVARIHDQLRAAALRGAGVLVISADLDELLALCHRVVVLLRGKIVGERAGAALHAADARAALGTLMTGAASAAEVRA